MGLFPIGFWPINGTSGYFRVIKLVYLCVLFCVDTDRPQKHGIRMSLRGLVHLRYCPNAKSMGLALTWVKFRLRLG